LISIAQQFFGFQITNRRFQTGHSEDDGADFLEVALYETYGRAVAEPPSTLIELSDGRKKGFPLVNVLLM